ncbi:MAG: hypothetical protein KGR26_00055 [Cyanobacteria bacterium REEB65]|nr:hypothetical protein [Cyanobacteria bacterium REEB65]
MAGRRPTDWQSELSFEHKVGGQLLGGVPAADSQASSDERSDQALGLAGQGPPRTFAEYCSRLAALFDAKRDRLVGALAPQPVFAVARREWQPKQPSINANIARSLTPIVVHAMEATYAFTAPPIGFSQAAGFLGTYDIRQHKITLTPQLFERSLKEFLDTLVHEEIHALQADLLLRLHVQKRGRPLSGAERAIAQYWKNEEPKYRSALAAGSEMSPQTKRRYQQLGQEYHAWTTGHFVASRLTGK